MRRTYRSKKDTGGGVDHRDMVLSVDAKSSIFDAYYIQNIKQVKREMSCVSSSANAYAATSYKVRKKKYVKRIKEPEPLRESISESAYLTPDKSIHVNKTPDLFDQLLNSSTNDFTSKATTSYKDALEIKQPRMNKKTYCRKKALNKKKINHSSSDSTDPDKENSMNDHSHLKNTSNIKAHKLVIEREKLSSPILLDDSINRVVKKFDVLNKLSKENTDEAVHKSCRFSNILIKDTQLQSHTSPQCSTPFREKYRGKSIYNFSPIQFNLTNNSVKQDESLSNTNSMIINHQNYLSGTTDNNNGTYIRKTINGPLDTIESIKTKDDSLQEHKDKGEYKITTVKSFNNDQLSDNEASLLHAVDIESVIGVQGNSLGRKSESYASKFIDNGEVFSDNGTTQMSSLYTSEVEPFIGFPSNNSTKQTECNVNNCLNKRDKLPDNLTTDEAICTSKFLSEQSVCESIDNIHSSSESSTQSNNETNVFVEHIQNRTSSSMSECVESESLYDTCDSENVSDLSLEEVKPKELKVRVEKLNDSTFQKYYKRLVDPSLSSESNDSDNISDDNNEISNIDESEAESSNEPGLEDNKSSNSSSINMCEDRISLNGDGDNIQVVDVQIISSSDTENSDGNNIEEEDKCPGFVTTRRRNDVSNDFFLFNLDNSYNSTSSATLDETVLSLNKERMQETDLIQDVTLVNDSNEENIYKNNAVIKEQHVTDTQVLLKENELTKLASDEEMASKNIRKSLGIVTESSHKKSHIQDDTGNGLRPGIVLKPGKKWERSLSIYRRMTTMGDTFNNSILDDECIKSKGRKYRQSVISTMEMQECQGSVHNESVFSRRSTFVSKPRRSTIKIFKDPNASSISLSSSLLYDDLEGFLNGDCDDTIIELSKLSIGDSGHEVTVLDKFHDTSNRIVTARDYVLRRCNQTEPVLFDECYPDTVLKNCRKIGEGVYGEVYLWRAGDGRARVMKIVPIAGSVRVNGEVQKDYHEIISEIVIAMELSALRAPIPELERQLDDGKEIDALDLQSVQNATDVFNEVLAVRCVYGAYPSRLLDLWELYDECKGSENDNPAALPVDQQYIVLELANAGQDLESFQFNNAEQACALFKQIALGLAVAEEAFQFEHRDLHWGNVLIAPTDQKCATFVIRGRLYRTARCGVAATLIDYSLSRAARDGRALYNDLADDDALFDAVGDYQFEVYRLMRDKLGNDWKNFEPYTNILWLHYTVDKMITALRYTRTNTKIHKHYIAKLKEIKNRVLDYGSATQFILTDNEF